MAGENWAMIIDFTVIRCSAFQSTGLGVTHSELWYVEYSTLHYGRGRPALQDLGRVPTVIGGDTTE